jgi:hypothetical protein
MLSALCAHAAGSKRTQEFICKQLKTLSFEQSGNNRRRELVADSASLLNIKKMLLMHTLFS